MRKYIAVILFIFGVQLSADAQQDPMYTQYMFNMLAYNPGYTGSKDYMAISLLHRSQWFGLEGGPMTQVFSIHSPLRNERIGLGMNVYNDRIGPSNQMSFNLNYAYRFPIREGYLGVGLQGGAMNWRSDFTKLNLVDNSDLAFSADNEPNFWLPNFGAGLYYSTKFYYVGVSVPHFLTHDLRKVGIETDNFAHFYRHYYFMGGMAFKAGRNMLFRPSFLIKNTGLFGKSSNNNVAKAPTELDLDAAILFYERIWFGASFRTAIDKSSYDSFDVWTRLQLDKGIMIGLGYDFTLTNLKSAAGGTFEVMLGYEFYYVIDKVESPRYF